MSKVLGKGESSMQTIGVLGQGLSFGAETVKVLGKLSKVDANGQGLGKEVEV